MSELFDGTPEEYEYLWARQGRIEREKRGKRMLELIDSIENCLSEAWQFACDKTIDEMRKIIIEEYQIKRTDSPAPATEDRNRGNQK